MFYKNDDWLSNTNNLFILDLENKDNFMLSSANPNNVFDTLKIEWIGCNISADFDSLLEVIEEQELITVDELSIEDKAVKISFSELHMQSVSNNEFSKFVSLIIKFLIYNNSGRNIVTTFKPSVLKEY